ncbi:MAG: GyrI-like domain-containing protein [Bacteroidota bacterium]|nr:GyrI-like domain-containing protein [Bacteroidota bacterium]
MKKLIWVLTFLLIAGTLTIYLLIPQTIHIAAVTTVHTTDIGTQRFLIDETQWPKWWDFTDSASEKTGNKTDGLYERNGDRFQLKEKFYKSADIRIYHNQDSLLSRITIIPLQLDSTRIEWTTAVQTGYNPVKRVTAYLQAKEVIKNMDAVLTHLRSFLSHNENIYGLNIEKISIRDTMFVAGKDFLKTPPNTEAIYQLIKKIQQYATEKGAAQSGSPIYNVTLMDKDKYQLMAAIPIDKVVPEERGFTIKKMVQGSFMSADVMGGEYTVAKASEKLHQFFTDFHKTSMAMNFNMLITDRSLQPDTSRWVTKLYMPVY